MKKSIRFNSEKRAIGFSKKVNGELRDLRNFPDAKSKFKVVFEADKKLRDYDNGAADFDSELNMNGTNWHTSEDL